MKCTCSSSIQDSKKVILFFSCAKASNYFLSQLCEKMSQLLKQDKYLTIKKKAELDQLTDKTNNCSLILMTVLKNLQELESLFPEYSKEFSTLFQKVIKKKEKFLSISGGHKHRKILLKVQRKISILFQIDSNRNDQLSEDRIKELWQQVTDGLRTEIFLEKTFLEQLFFTRIMPQVEIVITNRIIEIVKFLGKISHPISVDSIANNKKTFLSSKDRQLRNKIKNIQILENNIKKIMELMEKRFSAPDQDSDFAKIRGSYTNYFKNMKIFLQTLQKHILIILEMQPMKYRLSKRVLDKKQISSFDPASNPFNYHYGFFETFQFTQDPNAPNLNFLNSLN